MTTATAPARKGPAVDGVPSWMASLGIQRGEYLSVSKAQLRSQMRPDRPLKVQVWACGILHTAGYGGELATTMRQGKRIPLTAADIGVALHRAAIDHYKSAGIVDAEGGFARLKENRAEIRAALAALEEDGLVERQNASGTPLRSLSDAQLKRLPSGSTRILFWLKPRPAAADIVREQWVDWQAQIEYSAFSADDDDDDDADTEAPRLPMQEMHVGNSSLRQVPIQLILDVFQIEESEKLKINTNWNDPKHQSEYQEMIARAMVGARKIFLDVVNGSLPQELLLYVGIESTPDVGTGAATVRKREKETIERNIEESVCQSGAGPTDRHEDAPDYAAQFTALKTLLIGEYGRRFPGETPSSKLCASIITELQGAPLDLLQAHIRQRMPKATGMGFALSLAKDVGRRWREDWVEVAPKAAAARDEHARINQEQRALLWRETIDDPRASESEKEMAREFLSAAGGAS